MQVTRINGQVPSTNYKNSQKQTLSASKQAFKGSVSVVTKKPEDLSTAINYLKYSLNNSKIKYAIEMAKNKLEGKITVPPVQDVQAKCIAEEVSNYEEVKNIAKIDFAQ